MTEALVEGFLITRQWLEQGDSQSLLYWIATPDGPVELEFTRQESVAFVAEDELAALQSHLAGGVRFRDGAVELRTFTGAPVSACYFSSQRELNAARTRARKASITLYEADLRPTDRFLMERFITGAVRVEGVLESRSGFRRMVDPRITRGEYRPQLRLLSLDIETAISDDTLLSVAFYAPGFECVVMRDDSGTATAGADEAYLEFVPDEAAVLRRTLEVIADFDPDAIIGWNIVGFDLRFLQLRADALGIEFAPARDGRTISWRHPPQTEERNYALLPGRLALDGIELLRNATYSFESFALDYVAGEVLGRGKLVHDVDDRAFEIEAMFNDDKSALAGYNLEDCRLVWDVFEATNLMAFAVDRATLTGLDMDRMGGSVAAFDYLYLPRLHREGFVGPVVRAENVDASPGGIVLESRAGVFSDVLVLDFKSLYPSIVRTFMVDPMGLAVAGLEEAGDPVPGFKGGAFSREKHLLPGIIEELWAARDEAKRAGRGAMSQAIKIIMNSFYGVLGTPGCRFFDARLVSSITMRGHEILGETRDVLNERGFEVIYGDTDSVFVLLPDGGGAAAVEGPALAAFLNDYWRETLQARFAVESCLEVEYETHFERFFMPTVRGSDKGSKKRYAGLAAGEGLVFKGLESVRSDWSPLARAFQRELYAMVFANEPYDEFVRTTVRAVEAGSRDDELVLRKRIRRELSQYEKNVPPHVRAARRLEEIRAERGLPAQFRLGGGWVEYVMTVNGPEPARYRQSPIDYEFYVHRQLAPIADAILHFEDVTLASLVDRQQSLF